MELTDSASLTTVVQIQLSSLSSLVSAEGYILACDQASQELGWSYPVTSPTKVYWMIQRATRHALNILRIAFANKFKYKLVNLQQRFEHFQKMIEVMDLEFEDAMAADVALFANVESFKLFGTKIDAGFAYGTDGTDLTYDVERYVNFTPSVED